MSWMRCGHVLTYFNSNSTEYVWGSDERVYDYDSDYHDNCTFIELIHSMVYEATNDLKYANKILRVLAHKLKVENKLRLDENGELKPLSFEEYSKIMDDRILKHQEEMKKCFD